MDEKREGEVILFFTLHKCASVFISKICRRLSENSGMGFVSPNNGDRIDRERRVREHDLLTNRDVWHTTEPSCFAPIRFYSPLAPLGDSKIILHVRDPRDVLVSMYFSYCFIHPGKIEPMSGYRKEVEARGIDEFVKLMSSDNHMQLRGDYGTGNVLGEHIGSVLERYQNYATHVLSRKDVIFVKYEEMVMDFDSWLEKVVAPFKLNDTDDIVERISLENRDTFHVPSENIHRKKRQVTPGDHKNKLRPETIDYLNSKYGGVLHAFGYEQ